MTMSHTLAVHAVAFWSDRVPDWPTLRAICRGESGPLAAEQALPPSPLLSAAERRRAPESVLLALHVAQQVVHAAQPAVEAGGLDAARMRSVFASPHGDLGITHAMCEALANDPPALSPTRFVNSVHNAVSGHWGMAMRNAASSTAIANGRCTFAAAWLEAATQVACGGQPVLLVAYETEPRGATAQLTGTVARLALAMVLGPASSASSSVSTSVSQDTALPHRPDKAFGGKDESRALRMTWGLSIDPSPRPTTALVPALDHLAGNHLADALVWLQALAQACETTSPVLALPLSAAPDAVRIVWERFEG